MATEKEKEGAAQSTNKELEVIDPIYQKYVKSVMRAIGSSDFYDFFMGALACADNEFQFSNRRVEKFVDIEWIDAIEEALQGFQHVLSSPRNIIKEDEIIVNVANAKKGGDDVVRHLATHASLVEEYNANTNDVRPNKLMQKIREDTMGIYENRLVFTTLEKSFHFVKIRHDALLESMGDEFGAKLKVRSDIYSDVETVHMDMFMHIKDAEGVLEVDEKNREIFDRISRLYRILGVHMNSRFARHMVGRPRVKGAVMKTNVLKKDPNYKAIVKLFEFLSRYDSVGYTIRVIEQNPVINEDFERDIYHNILFNYLVLKGHLERDKDRKLPAPLKEKKRTLKPKFIKEIIEELTEDYDLPDVEIRKVLIEELTKEELMREEEAERLRLVEEQEQRKREEEERARREAEEAAEAERLAKEAEEEKRRQEQEILEAKLLVERMEREQEIRRRSGLFRKETEYFFANLNDRLGMREDQAEEKKKEKEDFTDAAFVVEETERLRAEALLRERQRKQQELAQRKHEAMLEQQRIEREQAEENERLRREEEIRQARQYEQDMRKLSRVIEILESFEKDIDARLGMRFAEEEARKSAEAERLEKRKRRSKKKLAEKAEEPVAESTAVSENTENMNE